MKRYISAHLFSFSSSSHFTSGISTLCGVSRTQTSCVSVASQSCCFIISSHVLPFPCNVVSYLVMALLISVPCWVFSSFFPLPCPTSFSFFLFLPFLCSVPLQICFCTYYLTLLTTPSISNFPIHLIQ